MAINSVSLIGIYLFEINAAAISPCWTAVGKFDLKAVILIKDKTKNHAS